MNMQIRTFDVERSKTHELGDLFHSPYTMPKEIFISLESLSLRELTVQISLAFQLYRMLKNDAVSGVPSVK